MHGFSLRLRLVGGVLLLGGCINSQNTQMPKLAVGDPRATRQGYQVNDPLPDIHPGGGYMNDAVPRGFDRARTEPRQAADRAASVGYYPRARVVPQPAPQTAPGTLPPSVPDNATPIPNGDVSQRGTGNLVAP